jgi:hypothetical protein
MVILCYGREGKNQMEACPIRDAVRLATERVLSSGEICCASVLEMLFEEVHPEGRDTTLSVGATWVESMGLAISVSDSGDLWPVRVD